MHCYLRQVLVMGLLAACCLAGGASELAAAESPAWLNRPWQTEDGLPDNSITGVAQTEDGFLWVATKGGLVRFDGLEFRVIPLSNLPRLPSRAVRAMFRDRRSRLWLGMERGPLICLAPDAIRAYGAADGVPTQRVIGFAEDRDGAVWVAYQRGLLRIHDGKVVSFHVPEGLFPGLDFWMTTDARGELWWIRGNRVGVFRDGGLRPLLSLSKPAAALCAGARSGLWICADGRLLRYEEGHEPVERGTLPEQATPLALFEDRAGALWIGTLRHGLLRLAGDRLEPVPTSHQEVTCLSEDREGNLWAGTAGGGLNLIHPRAVELAGRQAGLPFESVISVCADMEGRFWAASQGGDLARGNGGQWEAVNASAGWTGGLATCVAADQQGGVWVGTSERGLHYFRSGTWREWRRPDGLASDAVRSVFVASNGDVWAATDRPARLHRVRDGQVTVLKTAGRLGAIRSLAEGADGTIWIGTADGQIQRVSGLALVDEAAITEPAPLSVRCLEATPDGSLWIGYAGEGVGRLKAGKYARVTSAAGLMDDFVSQMLADSSGLMWITGNRGLSRVQLSELSAVMEGRSDRVRSRVYGRTDGLPSFQSNRDNFPSACRSRDGQLWFSTRSGLLRVQPDRIRDNPDPPPVLLERVSVDDHTVAHYDARSPLQDRGGAEWQDLRAPSAALRIPPDHRKVEFQFTALSFASPENVHFRYRLSGFDAQWIEVGPQRRAIYPRLTAGQYQFRVLACNNVGVWNEAGANLAVVVSPFFWETWWFRIGGSLGALLTVGGSVFIVSRRRYRQKLRRLEAKRALDQERARIAKDIHDDLGASLTHITLLSQPERHGSEDAAGVNTSLEQIHTTARQLTRAMEEVVWAVNPEHDTFDGLANYLGNYAQSFLHPTGMRCRLEMPMQLPTHPLSAEVRHNLFLAFKEALNNVVKHAAASEVRISLSPGTSDFVLQVEDDGKGFPVAGAAEATVVGGWPRPVPGNGLANMRSRLQEIGGTCDVQSRGGGGTTVKFLVPLRKSHDPL